MRLYKTIVAVALGAVMSASGAIAETPKNTLVIADAIDDIITLDPGEVSEVAGVLTSQQIYQPLVTFDVSDPTKITGVLAKSWEVSPDGKTFTFKMNPDAKFASGNPVTAYDAEFSLQRVVLMDSRISFILTQFGFNADNVKDWIKATDDSTLVIQVGDVYAPSFFLYCLSSYTGGIVDSKTVMEHVVDNDYGNAWLKQNNSAGSGPYVLGKWDPKQSILLNRNENYWGAAPGVDRIFIQQMPESATQRLALEKGDIDIANKLQPDDFDAIENNPDIKVLEGNSSTLYYFGLNVRNEALSNPKVVEAMKYLVDYKGIADTIGRGTLNVHQTMIPAGFLGAIDYNPYTLDIDKAKELLAESGVTLPIKLETVVWNTPPYTEFAQAVQATMSQAGINLDLQVVDGQQWLDRYRSHDLDIWVGLWGPDYPDPHSNVKAFTVNTKDTPDGSEGLADRFGWDAGKLSAEAMAAVREQDTDKRRAMYEAIQKEHTNSSPFIYMFQDARKVAVRSDVKGLVLGITYSDDRYGGVTKQ
ncbi:ABC transporter substrate-binding protein [Devosia rhodophyticola]|uniref:ABC transporter substrate-binding protein n=1 Tax=Devosia rhodophyticola TaxID=3026423 RepID=A0ABY7YWY5_9HYPH|nr:ABC transporter substrate-binding protein [Devosia rhodophyticola]WDR05883.1 ABC transporter substrate-binding protein [Devosia rhodophyticola]